MAASSSMWRDLLRVLGQLTDHAGRGDPVKAMVTAIVMLAAVVVVLAVPLGVALIMVLAGQ